MKMPRRITASQQPGHVKRKEWTRDRESFTHLNGTELTLFVGSGNDDDEYSETDGAPSVRVCVRSGQRFTFVHLSRMTGAELAVMRAFWERAFDYAEPICQALDVSAQHNFEVNGNDDSLMRLYRPTPQILIPTRSQRGDDTRLPIGPHGGALVAGELAAGAASDDDARDGDGVRVVPDAAPEDVGGEDHAPEVHGDAVVGEDEWTAGVLEGLPTTDAGTAEAAPDS